MVRTEAVAGRGLFRFDPGWLWVCGGLSLLACCMVVPAVDDLRRAEGGRDVALAMEARASEELTRHIAVRDELVRPTDRLVLTLAATHLNLVPEGTIAILDTGPIAQTDASPFAGLEVAWEAPEGREAPESVLQRLLTNRTARMWVAAFALLCVMYGVLPMDRR